MNKIKLVQDAYLHFKKTDFALIGVYWDDNIVLTIGDIIEDEKSNKYKILNIDFHSFPIEKVSLYVDNITKPVGEFLYKNN